MLATEILADVTTNVSTEAPESVQNELVELTALQLGLVGGGQGAASFL